MAAQMWLWTVSAGSGVFSNARNLGAAAFQQEVPDDNMDPVIDHLPPLDDWKDVPPTPGKWPANVPLLVVFDGPSVRLWKNYVSKQYYFFLRTLQNVFGWRSFSPHGIQPTREELDQIMLRTYGRLPDAILFWETYDSMVNMTTLMEHEAVGQRPRSKYIVFANDLHAFDEASKKAKTHAFAVADVVTGPYMYALRSFVPAEQKLPTRLLLPHAAPPLVVMQPNMHPIPKILLVGASSVEYYPYRRMVADMYERGDERLSVVAHPGYEHNDRFRSLTGHNYGRLLSSYVAVVTDGTIHEYAVAKMIEVPAAGSLLLVNAEMIPHLSLLGFTAGEHFYAYTNETMSEVFDFVLNPANAAQITNVRLAAHALVQLRHTTTVRAAEFHSAIMLSIAVSR
jgi:hypothetical protein